MEPQQSQSQEQKETGNVHQLRRDERPGSTGSNGAQEATTSTQENSVPTSHGPGSAQETMTTTVITSQRQRMITTAGQIRYIFIF